MNNGMHVEYPKSSDDGDHSKIANIVSELFSNELSGHKWKSQTKESLLTLIFEKVNSRHISSADPHYLCLMRALKQPKRIEECLEAMTTFLLGKGL